MLRGVAEEDLADCFLCSPVALGREAAPLRGDLLYEGKGVFAAMDNAPYTLQVGAW